MGDVRTEGVASDLRVRPRDIVADSWARSLAALSDPARAIPELALPEGELHDYREAHVLAHVMPLIRRLLVEPCGDTGLVVAVADERSRLLWVEGAGPVRRRAEGILFAPGADWSEESVGTSAPGTALALARAVQVVEGEHFSPAVQRWCCTAVPLHDPDSGRVLGVIDVTGSRQAVGRHAMALVTAAVAAAESELSIARLRGRIASAAGACPVAGRGNEAAQADPTDPAGLADGLDAAGETVTEALPFGCLAEGPAKRRGPNPAGGDVVGHVMRRPGRRPPRQVAQRYLRVLGRAQGRLHLGGERTLELSLRHTEILVLLAQHPAGLTTGELADLVNPSLTETTLRAEMLRLRRALEVSAPDLVPTSRPYCLTPGLRIDAVDVLARLRRGRHRLALGDYAGAVLPPSQAPGILALRTEVSGMLREAVLSDGSIDSVLRYLDLPEAEHDTEGHFEALRRLPPRSPKRAGLVTHLMRLDRELA